MSNQNRLREAVIQEDFRLSAARGLEWSPVWSTARECSAVRPWERFFFMAIAEGAADFAINWWAGWGPDIASQACIVEAAGGRVSDLGGEMDVDAEVQLVSNGVLHDEVLKRLNELVVSAGLDPGAEPTEDIPAIWAARATEPAEPWRMTHVPAPPRRRGPPP